MPGDGTTRPGKARRTPSPGACHRYRSRCQVNVNANTTLDSFLGSPGWRRSRERKISHTGLPPGATPDRTCPVRAPRCPCTCPKMPADSHQTRAAIKICPLARLNPQRALSASSCRRGRAIGLVLLGQSRVILSGVRRRPTGVVNGGVTMTFLWSPKARKAAALPAQIAQLRAATTQWPGTLCDRERSPGRGYWRAHYRSWRPKSAMPSSSLLQVLAADPRPGHDALELPAVRRGSVP